MSKKYQVILFYKYIAVDNPSLEVLIQRGLLTELKIKGRVLIGEEGINGTVAGRVADIEKYIEYLTSRFGEIDFKIDRYAKVPFPKLKVKARKEIVTLMSDQEIDKESADYIEPDQLQDILENNPDSIVLFDARNEYESRIGKFDNAITPDIKNFRDLPEWVENSDLDKEQEIVTYCTGGIRCEKFSALLKSKGYKNVKQLHGGIINYAKRYPQGHYLGTCFVFDERMSVAFDDNPRLISQCIYCNTMDQSYHNCKNKQCNALVVICNDCYQSNYHCLDCKQLVNI
ncbi:rhodanese-related sulfurtransferase [Candidatus Saccharibacteria bacterium]|nr:rhodanese-related sulfurtransferase [Candidatus Saccharibacteria bacterium]